MQLTDLEKQFILESREPRQSGELCSRLSGLMPHLTTNLESGDISFLVMKSVSLANSVSAREDELKNQGFMTRLYRSLTGANTRMRSENAQDLARIGLLSTRMLQEMLERQVVTKIVVLEVQQQLNHLTEVVYNLTQDVRLISGITRALELQHIAAKMKTPWGIPLRSLSVEMQVMVLAMEFYHRHSHVVNENTWIHFENILEQVQLTPDQAISLKKLQKEVAATPGVTEYFAKLGTGWEAEVENPENPGVLRELLVGPAGSRKVGCMELARELFSQCNRIQWILAERRALERLKRANQALQVQQKQEQNLLEKSVRTHQWYRLCNTHGVLENNLVYADWERTGVNLAWKKTRPNIQFIPEKEDPVLRHGMPFSIRFDHLDGDVRTLGLKSQRAGIPLGWSPAGDVSFEWVIWGKPVGTPVQWNELFSIRNVRVAGNLERPGGCLNYTELPGDVVNLAFGSDPVREWCVLL